MASVTSLPAVASCARSMPAPGCSPLVGCLQLRVLGGGGQVEWTVPFVRLSRQHQPCIDVQTDGDRIFVQLETRLVALDAGSGRTTARAVSSSIR